MTAGLTELVASRRLLICVGSGGVGKTTLAAAIGLRAARQGRKVLVLTIDPARRLANSLGLKRLGNEQTRIDTPGPVAKGGELWAMMLDTRTTFDGLIKRLASDDRTRRRILDNHIYRHISDSFASSQDYMATEKLYDVVDSGRYDLVVLDTPPVKNALDFIEAPGRLARFLDKRIIKWFLTPYDEGRVFGRLLMGTSAVVFRLLGYIFGREFLGELSEFFLAFRDLVDGFRARHEAVLRLFRDRRTGFLVVCAPTEPSVKVAAFFLEELERRRMPIDGLIVNQRHVVLNEVVDVEATIGEGARRAALGLSAHTADRLLARLGAAHRRLRKLSAIEDARIADLEQRLGAAKRTWSVPRLPGEVHDLDALDRLGDFLFG